MRYSVEQLAIEFPRLAIEIKIGAGRQNKAGDVTIKDVRPTAA